MIFLSPEEKQRWRELGNKILVDGAGVRELSGEIRSNLLPVFRSYAGALLASQGQAEQAVEWFTIGTMEEEAHFLFNGFLLGFLKRHQNRLIMPELCFADPRPFVHFTTVPAIRESREAFLSHCAHSLPRFTRPLRIMDLGCGDGALITALLQHLREVGKVHDLAEVLLVDSSPAMVDLASETVGGVFPRGVVRTIRSKMEEMSGKIDSHYDVAVSSLAMHHMPLERKAIQVRSLQRWVDHLIIFEVDANNDTPDLGSPELALSVYQTYGRLIDDVFAHDAPIDVVLACVDRFLMTEAVSFLTQPRGVRSDYHMLRTQWRALFAQELDESFACLCDSTAYASSHLDLFTLHFGR